MIKQAYINGFMRRCAIRGINPERLLKLAAVTTWDPDINMPKEPVEPPKFHLPTGNTVYGVVPIIPAIGSVSSTAAAQRAAAEAARARGAAAAAERSRRAAYYADRAKHLSELYAGSTAGAGAGANAPGELSLVQKIIGALGVGGTGALFARTQDNNTRHGEHEIDTTPPTLPAATPTAPRKATKLELE